MKLIISIGILLLALSCSDKQNTLFPTEKSLTESVYASATIQPDSLYQVYASISGILEAVFVNEGDVVSVNESLFEVINSMPKLNTENAKFALDLAMENYSGNTTVLKSIEDEILAATLIYKNDSINYFRQKNLWDNNIGSKAQYDSKKLNFELASNQLRLLENKYSRTKNELETKVKQAQNRYETASIGAGDFIIDSKIDGKVYAIYKEPGEIVTTMEPLAAIGNANHFIIELLVDEVDIVRVTEDQVVLINLDAYENDIFKATVSKIYPKKDERNQTFTIEAIFLEQPAVLYPGLSGEGNIIINKKNRVLTIPKSYIIDNNKVKTDDGLVEIEVGLENMEEVEILSGIDKNTRLYNVNDD